MSGRSRIVACVLFAALAGSSCRKRAPEVRDPAISGIAVQKTVAGQLGERYLASLLRWSPESASALGLHANDDKLDDRSEQGIRHILDEEKVLLAEVRAMGAGLDAHSADAVDLEILAGALASDILVREKLAPHRRMPDTFCEPLGALFRMATTEYGTPEKRARDMLARMRGLAPMLESARHELLNPPAMWTRIAIIKSRSAGEMFDALQAFLDGALPAEKVQNAQVIAEARKAYADFGNWLESDLLPQSHGEFRAGRELFTGLLKANYALDESPEELEQLGRRVMADTEKAMADVARTIDPKAKHWSDVVAQVKAKHPTAEGLVPAYRTEVARARKFLVDRNVMSFPPGDDLVVTETPPFLRATTQASYDQPAPFDATTRGFFFVTPVDPSWSAEAQEEWLRESDDGDVVDTAVHEAYPGHHLQLSVARRHPSLVRKAIGPSIFSEGWALYAEELMAELGYYAPHERLMQLEWTLVRAARVVLDVGLHTGSMTTDDAENFLVDRVHLERALAKSEVRRYSENPTQPLSYLVGREQIHALREHTRRLEGKSFSLKAFHDRLLNEGTVAPKLIERAWFGGH